MTKTEAVYKLLQHGPLNTRQILDIMGGDRNAALSAIYQNRSTGKIRIVGYEGRRRVYSTGLPTL